ncbi:hypothetical protein HJC23_008684 [Cyclotella cryptica]|uniref:Uncharacterized protein n=1 Tax=Cyclotella cryptica TaxID=29204 RepID=A0ABD3QGS1_9STRA|eukprot:CCRYP_005396-RA/>CCRYP_005396-RA protein AED:0.20 eAED:-0.09 QI:0/-1/0/1/-1/1/1/0/157
MPRPVTESPTTHSTTSPQQNTDTSTQHDNTSSSDTTSQHIQTLEQLDKQHHQLKQLQSTLENYVHQLQHEEKILRLALEQSSTSLKEQRDRERSRREEEAVRRLEEVLMGGGGGSSSDGSDADDDNVGGNDLIANEVHLNDEENVDDDWGDGKIAAV